MSNRRTPHSLDDQLEHLTPDSENLSIWNIWNFADVFDLVLAPSSLTCSRCAGSKSQAIRRHPRPIRYFPGIVAGDARGNSHALQHSLFCLSEFSEIAR